MKDISVWQVTSHEDYALGLPPTIPWIKWVVWVRKVLPQCKIWIDFDEDLAAKTKVDDWCTRNCTGRWTLLRTHIFFETYDDVALFQLSYQ
jgi:hypothetical protein